MDSVNELELKSASWNELNTCGKTEEHGTETHGRTILWAIGVDCWLALRGYIAGKNSRRPPRLVTLIFQMRLCKFGIEHSVLVLKAYWNIYATETGCTYNIPSYMVHIFTSRLSVLFNTILSPKWAYWKCPSYVCYTGAFVCGRSRYPHQYFNNLTILSPFHTIGLSLCCRTAVQCSFWKLPDVPYRVSGNSLSAL